MAEVCHKFGMSQGRFILLPLTQAFFAFCLWQGGNWMWAGVAVILFVFLGLDYLLDIDDTATGSQRHVRWFKAIIWAVAFLNLAVLVALAVFIDRETVGYPEIIAASATAGLLMGSACGAASHELIHRTGHPFDQFAGRGLLALCLRPDIAVEHMFGHHRYACLEKDPVTASRGTGFWRYLPDAVRKSFPSAWAFEKQRLKRRGKPFVSAGNWMLQGGVITILLPVLFVSFAGFKGLVAILIYQTVGFVLIELFNYIAHYGLVRVEGRPMKARHSWNSYSLVSTSILLNLPRHSSHHIAGADPYWKLSPQASCPLMPFGCNITALLALFPALYFRAVRPALEAWDNNLASAEERKLIYGRKDKAASSRPSRETASGKERK